VHILSQMAEKRLVYSLREDTWSMLDYPPRHENERVGCALGSWDSRMFVMEDSCGLSLSACGRNLVENSLQV
jgi:hypothetical protein